MVTTTHVDIGDCTDAKKCEAECKPGYIPSGGACVCQVADFVTQKVWRGPNDNIRFVKTQISGTTFNFTQVLNGRTVVFDPEVVLKRENIVKLQWDWYQVAYREGNNKTKGIRVNNIAINEGTNTSHPFGLHFFWVHVPNFGRGYRSQFSWFQYPTSGADRCPGFTRRLHSYGRHAENIEAHVVWKDIPLSNPVEQMIDYIQFYSCSPDNSGRAGLMAGVGLKVHLTFTCP